MRARTSSTSPKRLSKILSTLSDPTRAPDNIHTQTHLPPSSTRSMATSTKPSVSKSSVPHHLPSVHDRSNLHTLKPCTPVLYHSDLTSDLTHSLTHSPNCLSNQLTHCSNKQVHCKLQRQCRPEPQSTRCANGDNLHRVRLPPHRLLRTLHPHRCAPRRAHPLRVAHVPPCMHPGASSRSSRASRACVSSSFSSVTSASCMRTSSPSRGNMPLQTARSTAVTPFLYVINLYIIPICYVINL